MPTRSTGSSKSIGDTSSLVMVTSCPDGVNAASVGSVRPITSYSAWYLTLRAGDLCTLGKIKRIRMLTQQRRRVADLLAGHQGPSWGPAAGHAAADAAAPLARYVAPR